MSLANDARRGHPPGPWNGSGLLTWRHALKMVFRPLTFLPETADKYGDIAFFRFFHHRAYLLNHPDLIAQVTIHQADAFQKQPRQMNVLRQIFGDGVLLTEGKKWRTDRQYLQKVFGEPLMNRSSEFSVMQTNAMLDRWRDGVGVDMFTEMTRLTADISANVLVGEEDPEVVDQLATAIVLVSDEFAHEMNSIICLPDWLPTKRKKQKRESLACFETFFDDLMKRRTTSDQKNDDFLQYLLDTPHPPGADRHYIHDQMLTVLTAAYHATSMALVWAFYLLDEHPDVERRLGDELATVIGDRDLERGDLRNLPYLDCVMQEVLRIFPPAWSLFCRQSVAPVEMRGYSIKPGGWFFIAPWVTQRSERFFADPLKFDPDRFSTDRESEIQRYTYFPFGLGGHACIGARMALEQLKLIVGVIMRRTRLRNVDPNYQLALRAQLALRPANDIVMAPIAACDEKRNESTRPSDVGEPAIAGS